MASVRPAQRLLELQGRRLWLAAFMLALLVYIPTATYGYPQSIDTVNTAVQAYQIAATGSPNVDGIEGVGPRQIRPGRTGDVTNRLPGLVTVGVVAYSLFRPFGMLKEPATSLREIPLYPATIGAVLIVAAAMATLALALSRMPGVSRGAALGAAAVLAFGSATWSVSANALWTHSATQFALALAVLGLVSPGSTRAGVGFALAVFARPHTALMAAGGGLGKGFGDRNLRPVVIIGLWSLAGVAAAMAYGMWLFGGGPSIDLIGYRGYTDRVLSGGTEPGAPQTLVNLALLVVHPVRGLLPTTPVLIPLLVVLPAAWRQAPAWVRGLTIGAVGQLVIQGLVNPYTGGDAFFGSRLTLEFLTATMPLWVLAYMATADRPRLREWTHVTAGASVVVHAVGATVLRLGVIG
jgi:hypothetical protein